MEIFWVGHSCFRIKGKGAVILTDPFDASTGYNLGKPTADIVTVSIDLPDHNHASTVGGNPIIIDGPGEYEVAGVTIAGIASPRDEQAPRNTVYVLEVDELRVCHLGDLARVPPADLIEAIGSVDILMVPVGGKGTLDASQAAETISLLEPKVVVPMHYKAPQCKMDLEPLQRFLKEMGLKEPVSQAKLSLTKSSLPEGTQVVIMEAR